jgi:hypothetical protein
MWFSWRTVRFWSIALIFTSCQLLAFLTVWPWRWSQYILLKHLWTFVRLHGVISQKVWWSTAYQWFHHLKVCYPWQILWKFWKCTCKSVEHTLLVLEKVQYCHNRMFCTGWYTILPPCWNLLQESVVYIYFLGIFFYILTGPFIEFLISGISIFYVCFLNFMTPILRSQW